jgi:Tfp pilus assembly protein PilV
MNNINKKAFTLIEVLVSVLLIFIMGFTLTKISSQNINTLQSSKEDYIYLYSAVVNSSHEYKDINDFIDIRDIPKYTIRVEKTNEVISVTSLSLIEGFKINYTTKKESIKNGKQTKAFFLIK